MLVFVVVVFVLCLLCFCACFRICFHVVAVLVNVFVLFSVFWRKHQNGTLLVVIEKKHAGFRFRRKNLAVLSISEEKHHFVGWSRVTSPDEAQTCCCFVSNLKARTLCFVFSWTISSIFQRCLWKTCKIGNIHKTESLSWACKFFAVKWEFAEMGIWNGKTCYFSRKWDPILSRIDCRSEKVSNRATHIFTSGKDAFPKTELWHFFQTVLFVPSISIPDFVRVLSWFWLL